MQRNVDQKPSEYYALNQRRTQDLEGGVNVSEVKGVETFAWSSVWANVSEVKLEVKLEWRDFPSLWLHHGSSIFRGENQGTRGKGYFILISHKFYRLEHLP